MKNILVVEGNKKIHCVLLVDDDLAGNAFHTIAVKQSGVCELVRTVTNGRKALDYIKNSKIDPSLYPVPDIIYLDINMPGMNGFEFLTEYKNLDDSFKSQVRIIMLSNSINPDDKERALSFKEVTDFQSKPLTAEVLKEAVEKYF